MSQENVEIVRELAEGFRRRQHERAFEFYDPEIEWDASGLAEFIPDIAGVYHGHDGVRAYWRNWLSAWSDLHFEIQDVVDAGDDVVLLIHNQEQWGRHSGISTVMPPLRDGVHASQRKGRSLACLFRPGICSRGRRAFAVGDVPGEGRGCGLD